MKIIVGCPSYKRSKWLGRAIHCFQKQTHLDSEMVIIEDSGSMESTSDERWRLIGTKERYANLGAKRNAIVEQASPDTEGYMVLDDDDCIWPGAVAAVSKALERHPWAQCRHVYETAAPGMLMTVPAFGHIPMSWGYGGCWAYRLKEFREMGGYANEWGVDDIPIARRFYRKYGPSADSSIEGTWYWYNREGWKICNEGNEFWERREMYEEESNPKIHVGWNGPNLHEWPVIAGVQSRPF